MLHIELTRNVGWFNRWDVTGHNHLLERTEWSNLLMYGDCMLSTPAHTLDPVEVGLATIFDY
jgi:hypothetical protein